MGQSVASELRKLRWRRQAVVQEILPQRERVTYCLRRAKSGSVDVVYNQVHQAARYSGLMTCGSVWHCPVCAARIAERRREELERAVARCVERGGTVWLATYTVSHSKTDRLPDLLKSLEAAMRRMRQGRASQALRKEFGVLGTVTVREVTYSEENGWHPHFHCLWMVDREVDGDLLERVMRQRWEEATAREGLVVNEHGFKLDKAYRGVAGYVTKLGRELGEYENASTWSVSAEVARGYAKNARSEHGITPFRMLDLVDQGLHSFAVLFREYAFWYKGKRQIVWSKGLRAELLGNDEELTDAEVAAEPGEEVSVGIVLYRLTASMWEVISLSNLRGELLEIARHGERELIEAFLINVGVKESSAPGAVA